MIAKLICSVMGHVLDRQYFGFGWDPETRVFRWFSQLACLRCGWSDIRKIGAPSIGEPRRTSS